MSTLRRFCTMATKPTLTTIKSNAASVREFNVATGQSAPNKPELMSAKEVDFIGKMIIDELLELYSTVMGPDAAKEALKNHVDKAKVLPQGEYASKAEKIGEQADAFVDIWYYSLNAAAKRGVNVSSIFDRVHAANMAKRDPTTGKFIRRESDGKIMKPAGWTAPDITAEIERQTKEGSFEVISDE